MAFQKADEISGLTTDLEIRQPRHQLAKDRVDLSLGQTRTQTIVGAWTAQRNVLVRRARDVKAIRVFEDTFR